MGAIALAKEALQWWPDYTDLIHEEALAHLAQRDFEGAARAAERAIAQGDAPSRYVAVSGKGSFQTRVLLAQALREQGDRAAAREQLTAAVREAPNYLSSSIELVQLLLDDNAGDGAAAFVAAGVLALAALPFVTRLPGPATARSRS